MGIQGWDGLRSFLDDNRVGDRTVDVRRESFAEIDVPPGEIDCGAYFGWCTFSDVRAKNSRFLKTRFTACTFENFDLAGIRMASTRFSNVTFRDSVLKDSPLLKLNDTNSFAEVDNCTFENVVLRGDGSSVIKLFTNSTFSGKLKNIGFREDDDHRFGIGLDLSNAELDKVSFTGIDMRRIKCNPAWSDYIVDDWYKYAGALKQIVADCLGDDYGYVMGGRSPEQSAAAYLHYDLLRDEIDYGGPADEARGAKFLDYLYNSRDPEARAHMINFYRQAGIDPPNLPS